MTILSWDTMEMIWIVMEDIGKLHPLVTSENDTEDPWFPVLKMIYTWIHMVVFRLLYMQYMLLVTGGQYYGPTSLKL